MNTRPLASTIIALPLLLVVATVRADLPATNQVANYERCDSEGNWRELPKSDGEVVLACLRDIDNFKTWGSTVSPGIIAVPIPTIIGFRVVSGSGETNLVHFSEQAELVDVPRGLLVVPDKEEEVISQLLAQWRKADSTRISSQPLPCKYRIGAANDGGTLSGVARLFYGDSAQWRRIYEANKPVIKNPNIINGGTVITIPRVLSKGGAANGSQPIRSETNRLSSAAGSRR